MPEKVRVAKIDDLPVGSTLEVAVEGRIIALYHVEDKFYAIDGICPHAGGPLGSGFLEGNIVTCPWHGWQFDVSTGQHCLTPTICQASYSVTVEGQEIFVDLAATH